jgi:glycosyltransferase involved in cell wall biosynthesis
MSPFESGEAAAKLAGKLQKPWVADLRDPWALDEMAVYPTALHRHLELRRMRRVLGSASAIVMNTPEAEIRVRTRLPELSERLAPAIPNGFDQADFDAPLDRPRIPRFRIVHAGYLHTELGLQHRSTARIRRLLGGELVEVDILTRSHLYLINAIHQLAEEDPGLTSAVEVVLAGVLTASDTAVANGRVRAVGFLTHSETVQLMRTADLLFLPLHNVPPGYRAGIVPGKLYEYLASGRPILAAVPDGDARDILVEAGNAFICRPDDSAAMKTAIRGEIERWHARQPATPPRPEVVARYERRRLTRALAAVFDEVLGVSSPSRG